MKTVLLIQKLCAEIDLLLTNQLDSILHHIRFQELEATWRGLDFLVQHNREETIPAVMIKCISLSLAEFKNDLEDYEKSRLFTLIYSQEFDQAGGRPFGLLLIDQLIQEKDTKILTEIAKISSLSFCFTLLGGAPNILGFKDYEELRFYRFHKLYSRIKLNSEWLTLRKNPEARFLGISTGRILIRPYYDERHRGEMVYDESRLESCWLSHHYLYAAVIMDAFKRHSWFHDLGQPLKIQLERNQFLDQVTLINEKQIALDEALILSSKGFISASDEAWFNQIKFHFHPTLYRARSIMLSTDNFTHSIGESLCISRLAHTAKIILRDKLSLLNIRNCEQFLQNWIQNYCAKENPNSLTQKFKFPLEEASFQIHKIENISDSSYQCTLDLKLNSFPHKSKSILLLKI